VRAAAVRAAAVRAAVVLLLVDAHGVDEALKDDVKRRLADRLRGVLGK
jgi:hypothetical protein